MKALIHELLIPLYPEHTESVHYVMNVTGHFSILEVLRLLGGGAS